MKNEFLIEKRKIIVFAHIKGINDDKKLNFNFEEKFIET